MIDQLTSIYSVDHEEPQEVSIEERVEVDMHTFGVGRGPVTLWAGINGCMAIAALEARDQFYRSGLLHQPPDPYPVPNPFFRRPQDRVDAIVKTVDRFLLRVSNHSPSTISKVVLVGGAGRH